MRPLDPRLLRYARSTRTFIVLAVVLGVAVAVLVIIQARMLAGIIVGVTSEGMTWSTAREALVGLAGVFAGRALISWLAEIAAFRSSARAKQELRAATISHVLALGPAGPAGEDPGAIAALVTRGVDGLDGYFARYLPQLVLSVIVPVAVLLTVVGQDLLSTVIIAVTLPLIPLFMALIGLYTRTRVDRQWRTLARLSGHFLDLIAGLPTLKLIGRAQAQARAIRAIGDDYRSATMSVLRISFLSSLALELLASLSVALVAVSVGLRLASGNITFAVALFVLVLAPEAYLPLRLVGQHFHAAAEGLGAAERMLALLEVQPPAHASGTRPAPTPVEIRVRELVVASADRVILGPVSFTARRGQVVALVGPSGGGKTTLLSALLGLRAMSSGGVDLIDQAGGTTPLSDCDPMSWRAHIGWVPQRSHLVGADVAHRPTIRSALQLSAPHADDAAIWTALQAAGVAAEVQAMPGGLSTVLGDEAAGVSAGQAQRLALARALLRRPAVLLLDEPTAALDSASEALVVSAVRAAADAGAIVLLVAHRPALVAVADTVVRIERSARDEGVGDAGDPGADATDAAENALPDRPVLRGAGW